MKVVTVQGCAACGGRVSGNAQLGWLCGRCNLLYATVPRHRNTRKTVLAAFETFVRSPNGDTYHVRSCKYARRIRQPVAVDDGERRNLRACACVRRGRR